MVMVDVPDWRERVAKRKERKANVVKEKEVTKEEIACKRLRGILKSVEDNPPVEDCTI